MWLVCEGEGKRIYVVSPLCMCVLGGGGGGGGGGLGEWMVGALLLEGT